MEKEKKLWMWQEWKMRMILMWMICAFFIPMHVYAAKPIVLSARVHDKSVYIYVRGITNLQADSRIQIGAAAPCDNSQIAVKDFGELEEGLRTLIMIDNSQSIPENNRKDIQEIIENIVKNATAGESFRIATFAEEAMYLCDYTKDADSVIDLLSVIAYQDQETYFSDVLHGAIQKLAGEDTERGTRILIFSDGADNKYLGVTNDEVRTLIGQNDGGEKNISLKLNGEEGAVELITKITMPFGDGEIPESQQSRADEGQGEKKTLEKREGREKLTPDTEKKEEQLEKGFPVIVIVLIVIAVVFIIVATIVFLFFRRKEKAEIAEPKREELGRRKDENDIPKGTMLINEFDNNPSVELWHGKEKKTLILENLDVSEITYTKMIGENERVYLLREKSDSSPGPLDIVINDSSVSAKHCFITLRGGLLYIKDCNSSNGTFYEQARVYDEIPMISGRQIRVGKYHYRVVLR